MTLLTNSAEGGTNGTGATTGNTGGVSGNAADTITTATSCTVTFDNTHAAHGTLSYAMAYGATAGNVAFDWSTQMGTQSQVWFRLYLYLTANPAAATRFWGGRSSGTTCGNLYISTTGKLQFRDAAGTTIITSTNSVPLNAWFRVEGFLIGSATVGQMEFKLFSSPDSATPTETQTSAATQNTNTSLANYIFGNEGTTVASYTYWQDDLGLSNTGYIGPSVSASVPLVLEQAQRPRETLRRSQGKFFIPGQFNLDGNPYPSFIQQAQRARLSLRRGQGKFFNQAWGQGNQGIIFPLYLRQARSSAKWGPVPRRGQWFNPGWGQGNQGVQFPLFMRQDSRKIIRPSRGRFFTPGQFNETGNPFYPGFMRTAERLVPAKPRHGRFFDPGQFNETAASLPQFIRTSKRPVLPVRHGNVFRVPGTVIAPVAPQYISVQRAKITPSRRGRFQQWNIPQVIIPVWPPEFRATRRVNFTRIRHGNIIQLVPFQLLSTSAPVFKTGTAGFAWTTGGMSTGWRTGP